MQTTTKISWSEDLPAMIFFSVVGFLASWLLGLIPIVGVVIALVTQFFLGFGLGYFTLHWFLVLCTYLLTALGLYLGFAHGSYAHSDNNWHLIVLLVGLLLFGLGYDKGLEKGEKEELRNYEDEGNG